MVITIRYDVNVVTYSTAEALEFVEPLVEEQFSKARERGWECLFVFPKVLR